MEQDPRIRPMSPEENAAYRGVTVDESGAEPQDEARHGSAYGGGRGSVRYVRIGTGIPRRSLFSSIVWAAVFAALLAAFLFVALPAIAMILVAVLIAGTILRLKEELFVNALLVRQLLQRLQKLLAAVLLLGIFSCQPQSLLKIDMQAHL